MANKKWIQEATKHKGALRKKAAKQGLIKGDEKLSMADLNKLEKEGGKTAKQASLAKTLRTFADGGVIASNIIMQLGGFSRLQIMLGAYNFVDLKNGLSFKIKNPKANYIKITLNGKDLYDIEIGRIRGTTYKVVHSQEDVYAVDLRKIIEKHTGMYMAFEDGGDVVLEDAYYRDGYTDEETLILSSADKLANGGITAMEVLEAREFVGEKDWVKMKPKERLSATRYLIRTGKIGYYAYANGGTTKARPTHKSSYTKKYKVKYLIGYSDEEEGLKYHEGFYYADSKDVAALEVFDHLQRQGYTHIEILGISLVADKGMEVQSDEQLMQKYKKLKGNVPDWFRDMPTRYKVEIIDEIEDGYEGEKPEGDEFARGGSIESKRERVVDYYINNEDDEVLNFEYGVNERALENRDKYYKEIYEKISSKLEDEEIYYKFRELNLDEASEEPDYDEYADGGQMSDKVNVYVLLNHSQYYWSYGDNNNDTSNKKYWFKLNGHPVSREVAKQMADKYLQKYNLPLSDYKIGYVRRYGRYADGGMTAKGGKVKEKIFIEYLNKNKGYVMDRKYFNSYEEAESWARDNFDKFDNDYIKYEYEAMAKGGEVEKIYGERIITDKNGNQYAIKNWAAQGYIIPFNGSQYWEHFRVPKENWIKIEDINWSKFNISKSDFYNYLDSLNQKASEILNKYRSSFAKGGKVKNPAPDYPDFVSMQYKIGGDIEWGEDLGDGFSVGNDVYITDSKSMHKGKTGFVSGLAGKDLLVTISENGNERSIVVSKKGVEMLDTPMAKGGMTKEVSNPYEEFLLANGFRKSLEVKKDKYTEYRKGRWYCSINKATKEIEVGKYDFDYSDEDIKKYGGIREDDAPYYHSDRYTNSLTKFKKFLENYYILDDKMAKGGQMDKKPAKFKDKVKAISKSLEGKKVPKRVRKDYGATYDKKESMDAAKRIVGSMAKKERKRYEI